MLFSIIWTCSRSEGVLHKFGGEPPHQADEAGCFASSSVVLALCSQQLVGDLSGEALLSLLGRKTKGDEEVI